MILNEKDYIGGLKQWAGNHMKAAKDSALAVAGSKSAVGRLNIRATTDELIANWKAFCGQREQAGIQGWDKYDPTMAQIEQFLKTRYNVDLSMADEPEIADAAEAAGVEEGEPIADESGQSDDDAENQALAAGKEATTPDEVAHLKKLAAGDNVRAANKPGPAKRSADPAKDKLRADMDAEIENDKKNGVTTRESVELNEAGRGDALRKLFGTIALHMFDNGMVNITRGGTDGQKATIHSRDGERAASSVSDDGVANVAAGTTVETRVDNNGNYLNAIKLRDGLKKQGIDSRALHLIKASVKQGSLKQMFLSADEREKTIMVKVAAVTVAAIQKASSKMKAGDNVTTDGNTLNFNAFMSTLEKNKVGANAFILATQRLNKASADGEIDMADVEAVMGSGDETSRAVLGIMGAMVMSIEGVGKQKAEKPAEPAAAPEQKAEAE